MKDFLATLKLETLLTDGAMGSYLFELNHSLCSESSPSH